MTGGEHIRGDELELLALGALPEEEAAALKAHLEGCAECATKLAQTRGGAALLAFAAKQEKPAGTIKAELLSRVRANEEREEHFAWPLPPAESGHPHTGEFVTNPRNTNWMNWVLVTAAVALAIVSLALSWQNRRVSRALEKQRQATQALLRDREETDRLVGVLAAADTLTVKLASAGETIGTGVVKYNARMGMVIYSAQLPAAPAGKSYQLWLVPPNGTPINAGVLEKGARSLGPVWIAEVPANTEAKTFSVTLEQAGGAPQPTGPKVLVGAS